MAKGDGAVRRRQAREEREDAIEERRAKAVEAAKGSKERESDSSECTKKRIRERRTAASVRAAQACQNNECDWAWVAGWVGG